MCLHQQIIMKDSEIICSCHLWFSLRSQQQNSTLGLSSDLKVVFRPKLYFLNKNTPIIHKLNVF